MKPVTATMLMLIAETCLSCTFSQEQETMREQSIHQTVPAAEFQQKLAATQGELLDVRTPEEYAEGHLEGANLLNFYDSDFSVKLKALPKDKTYFVYCRSGGRSGKTLGMMKDAGFQVVYDLGGGITAWKAEGLPLAAEK